MSLVKVREMEPGTYFTKGQTLYVRLKQSRIAALDGSGDIWRLWFEDDTYTSGPSGGWGLVVEDPLRGVIG